MKRVCYAKFMTTNFQFPASARTLYILAYSLVWPQVYVPRENGKSKVDLDLLIMILHSRFCARG